MTGHEQTHNKDVLVSELGSLNMEFTKLSQLTGDAKYYDAVQRIADFLERDQPNTKLPGLWPVMVKMKDPSGPDFTDDNFFTLGGMSDSLYEYFPKQYLLLGGALEQPRKLYENFIEVAKSKLFKRVLNPENKPIVMSGDVRVKKTDGAGEERYNNKGQHLTCFVGGMVGLSSKIFNRPDELDLAAQLTEGCVWAYSSLPVGVMPELFQFAPCGGIEESQTGYRCAWEEREWRKQVRDQFAGDNADKQDWDPMGPEVDKMVKAKGLVPGFVEMVDKRYILRPEAIESVFIMYRLTGDGRWAEAAWAMFEAVERLTRTGIAAAGVRDVTGVDGGVDHLDSMESFWLAETLKYFYLVFSEWDVVDLDRWVLNTEAHPLKRPDVA